MSTLRCLRCGSQMKGPSREKFQLGEQGVFSNHWAHLIAGALEADVYMCPGCGKIEMFVPNSANTERDDTLPQKECPGCGLSIDFDYPKCPCCGYEFE